LTADLYRLADEKELEVFGVEDVLTYALFPQVGLRFLEHRGDPSAFEPPPGTASAPAPVRAAKPQAAADLGGPERYQVTVNGRTFDVQVAPGGAVTHMAPVAPAPMAGPAIAAAGHEQPVNAPLAGVVLRVLAHEGQRVEARQVVLVMEAMKMETEIRAPRAGSVMRIALKEGNAIELGQTLFTIV
jgi:oxaloacetate decarboxylase alpha subunit